MATGTTRRRASNSDPKPEPVEGNESEAKDENENPDPGEGDGSGNESEGHGEDEGAESGALVNPTALLQRAAEAEANSDRKPPMATWGQFNYLSYLIMRVILGFTEDQANEARTRHGASGLISTLVDEGKQKGIVS